MYGIERTERRWKGFRCTPQDRAYDVDGLDAFEQSKHRRSSRGDIGVSQHTAPTEPIERPQTLDLRECTRHRRSHALPFGKLVGLTEHEAQHDRRVEVGDHRDDCRSARSAARPSTRRPRGRGSGALCNGRMAWRTANGSAVAAYGTRRATGVSRSQTTTD